MNYFSAAARRFLQYPVIFYLLVEVFCFPRLSFAQKNVLHLTLPQCLHIASTESPEFQRLNNQKQIAECEYKAASAFRFPQLSLRTTLPWIYRKNEAEVFYSLQDRYGYILRTDYLVNPLLGMTIRQALPTNGALEFSFTGIHLNSHSNLTDDRSRFTGGISVDFRQPLFSWNQNRHALETARMNAELARLNFQIVKNELWYSVIDKYYTLLLQQKQIEIEAHSLREKRILLTLVTKQLAQGKATELDQINTEIEISNFELTHLKSIQLLEKLTHEFTQFAGLPPERDLVLSDEFSREVFDLSLNQTLLRVQKQNPLRKIAGLNRELQRLFLKALEATNHIQCLFTTGLHFDNQYEVLPVELNHQFYRWNVGLDFEFPLWDGGTADAKIQAARLKLKNENISDSQQEAIEIQEITALYQSLAPREKMLAILEKTVYAAEKAYELSKKRYETGQLLLSDLLVSERQLMRAKIDGLAGLIDYNKTIYQLKQKTGMDIIQW
jgi:outer membrane protein TolC